MRLCIVVQIILLVRVMIGLMVTGKTKNNHFVVNVQYIVHLTIYFFPLTICRGTQRVSGCNALGWTGLRRSDSNCRPPL